MAFGEENLGIVREGTRKLIWAALTQSEAVRRRVAGLPPKPPEIEITYQMENPMVLPLKIIREAELRRGEQRSEVIDPLVAQALIELVSLHYGDVLNLDQARWSLVAFGVRVLRAKRVEIGKWLGLTVGQVDFAMRQHEDMLKVDAEYRQWFPPVCQRLISARRG